MNSKVIISLLIALVNVVSVFANWQNNPEMSIANMIVACLMVYLAGMHYTKKTKTVA